MAKRQKNKIQKPSEEIPTSWELDERSFQILDAISDLILVKKSGSHIVWGNKAFRDFYGMSNKQLRDMIDAPFSESDHTQQYVKDDTSVFQSGETLDIPTEPVTRCDGEVRLFHTVKSPIRDAQGRIVMTVGVSRDIREKKKAELALEKELDFSSSILRETPTMVFGIGPDGTTQFVNAAVQRITGYSARELVGHSWWDRLFSGQDPVVIRLQRKILDGAVSGYEIQLKTKSGKRNTILWTSLNRLDDRGALLQVVVFGLDITDQRRMENILKISEKMSAVGQLAAGIAHELNNPMAVILGFAQSALSPKSTSEGVQSALRNIVREAERCRLLVQNLLTFSRVGAAGIEELHLHRVIENVIPLIEPQAKLSQICLETQLGDSLPPLLGNAVLLQQVIINLATNAMAAIGKNGTIAIQTELLRDGNLLWILLHVRDTGPGISPDVLPRIFEPFFTTKPPGQGTGLGLGLVHEIVEKHFGTIEVTSEPGRTEFIIKLPAKALPAIFTE